MAGEEGKEMPKMMDGGQIRAVSAKLVRLAPAMSYDYAQALMESPDEVVREFLAKLLCLPLFLPFPEEGVEFELTLDGDAVDPLGMVKSDGYAGEWGFHGRKISGKQTRRFKLLRADGQPSMNGVIRALGQLSEGEWREAFRRKFLPVPGAFVGFGDPSWTAPREHYRLFPFLIEDGGGWDSGFRRADYEAGENCLWLVPMAEQR